MIDLADPGERWTVTRSSNRIGRFIVTAPKHEVARLLSIRRHRGNDADEETGLERLDDALREHEQELRQKLNRSEEN